MLHEIQLSCGHKKFTRAEPSVITGSLEICETCGQTQALMRFTGETKEETPIEPVKTGAKVKVPNIEQD